MGGCDEFKKYMMAQIDEINLQKWLESEKAGRDLGTEFTKKWVETNARKFREKFSQEHD